MPKSYTTYLLFFSLFFFTVNGLSAQELVANINQANAGSSPKFLSSNDEWTVFFADDGVNGSSLYVIDEPGASPLLFADEARLSGATITRAFLVDDAVYLSTGLFDESQTWRADLVAGTYTLLIENNPNTRSQQFRKAVSFGDQVALFFNITEPDIWLTDGTMAGTSLAATALDVNLSNEIVSVDSLVYFVAESMNEISQLWRSDGTQSGTFPVTDFNPGNTFVRPSNVTAYAGNVFFAASDSAFDYELYRTDGTRAGTLLFYEFDPGPRGGTPSDLQVFNDTLFFRATSPATGLEIWYTDGMNTAVYADLVPGQEGLNLFNFHVGSSLSYFSKRDSSGIVSLWRTDFSPEGTFSLLPYFSPGTVPVNVGEVSALLADGNYFFLRQDTLTGQELWVTDGSLEGTNNIGDLFAGPSGSDIGSLRIFEDHVYFIGNGDEVGQEVWTATANENIELVLDVNSTEGSSFPIIYDTTATGSLLLSANITCVGRELLTSDRTAATTELIKDINPGAPSADISSELNYLGKRYFVASPTPREQTLYVTDGTTTGTKEVLRFKNADGRAVSISKPSLFKGKIYISGGGGDIGQMLLAYDPVTETVDTIQQIIGEGGINGGFRPFVLNDSTLLFSSQVLGAQAGLYQTDGTREGTSLILAGSMSSARFIGFDGAAFVIISDQAVSDIWRTDGTPTGTQRLSSGNSLRNLQNMTVIGDRLYFIASGFASQGLYYFSTSSTQINQINPPNGASLNNLSNLLNYNGQLFFTGDLSGSGIELLTTDGTSAGTRLVKDIVEGEESGHPRDFVVANDILYFSAFNPSSGRELYHSDGTTEGTQLIADINPGPASGSPDYLYNYRGVIYFSADDGLSGAELWRYSPADPTATDEANNPNDVVESCPDTTTNLNEVLPPSTLTISPNPARGQTIIDLSPGVFRLELYSATGQILWSSNRQTGRAELDLSQQAAGNYFLRVIEATTGRHRVEKLVVLR